jgi:hypothetical protein
MQPQPQPQSQLFGAIDSSNDSRSGTKTISLVSCSDKLPIFEGTLEVPTELPLNFFVQMVEKFLGIPASDNDIAFDLWVEELRHLPMSRTSMCFDVCSNSRGRFFIGDISNQARRNNGTTVEAKKLEDFINSELTAQKSLE